VVSGANPLTNFDAMLETALNHQRSGRYPEAERACGEILAIAPHQADALHLLGMVRYLQNDLVLAERLMRRSLELRDDIASYHSNLAEVYRATGRFNQAIAECGRALVLDPKFAGAWLNKGLAHRNAGEIGTAIDCFRSALAINPDFDAARRALAHDLAGGGHKDEALVHARELEKRAGENAEAWHNLGNLWKTLGEALPAVRALRRSIELGKNAEAMNDYGVLLQLVGDVLGAAHWLQQAIAAAPDIAHQHSNLGNVLRDLGDWEGAIGKYRRALELKPDFFVAHSNILFTRLYDPQATGEGMRAEAEAWGERHAAGLNPRAPACPPDGERRLRIGYVSPDFRDHAVGFLLEPLEAAHDRQAVEVTCYSATVRPDAVTERMRTAADRWREVAGMGDDALAEMIRADGIDILVDCAGHTSGNRLLALARRPAPVQATMVLGHGGTTGLAAVDYVLTDGAITPEGMESHFSEKVVRLPRVFAPFRVRTEWPVVGPLPEGPAVFGCFADPARIDGACVEWWRRILEAVPGARIFFKNAAYGDERMVAHWRRLFGRVAERADFEDTPGGWGKNMGAYRRVWAMLDSWPVTGATSTLIPLWMGVPVVTLAGGHAGQRFGAAIVTGVGMAELAAQDAEEYMAKAVALVRDRARLETMRRTLRARMAASPFCDAAGVARDFEAAYRALWRTWCQNP
jgi:predicted O-linked N-acetylglucosamine transferase (SPINDLY family)